jgi:endopolyphosphatase
MVSLTELLQFFFLEATELDLPAESSGAAKPRPNSHEDLYTVLLQDFAELPKRKATDEANFVPVNVAASLVPNPYFPAFRIYVYNTTGATSPTIQGKNRKHGHRRGPKVDKKRCKDAPWKDRWRCHLTSKWHIDPDSPARKNKLWTPLGFAQVCVLSGASTALMR